MDAAKELYELDRELRTKAVTDFFEKTSAALKELEQAIGELTEESMIKWNKVLSTIRDDVLAL